MNVKLGKERIQQLINDAIDKYEKDVGDNVVRNQTVTHYTGLASKLSEVSNRLPTIYPENFEPDSTGTMYNITPAQIRDALFGKVEKLKEHFNAALNVYLYDQLSPPGESIKPSEEPDLHKSEGYELDTFKENMNVVSYKPTEAEIEKLTGIWTVYNGSPQVRKSNPNRYRKIVHNIIEVKYTASDTLFTFKRYGSTIDQVGYMQFEDKNLVSIHTYFKAAKGNKLIPKLSLMQLENGRDTNTVISASWTWDSESENNVMIGIREVFIKLGKGGRIEDVTNTLQNIGLEGKVLYWTRDNGKVDTILLRNARLETLPKSIQPLLDETSIIPKDPDSNLIIKKH